MMDHHDESLRSGFGMFLSNWLAENVDTPVSELYGKASRNLRVYGMEQKEMTLFSENKGAFGEADGKAYLTPQTVKNFSDESVARYLGKDSVTPEEATSVRDTIEDRLRTFIVDNTDAVHLNPSAADKAVLNFGFSPNSAPGFVFGIIGIFKQWSVTWMRRVLARDLYGNGQNVIQTLMSKGGAQMIISRVLQLTAFGYLSNMAKNIAQGLNPPDVKSPSTWGEAFSQGGGLGLFLDAIFMNADTSNHTLTSQLGGPGFKFINQMAAVASNIIYWKHPLNAIKAVINSNFNLSKLPYISLAYNHLIGFRRMEHANPGSVERLEHKREKENNANYYWSPTSAL